MCLWIDYIMQTYMVCYYTLYMQQRSPLSPNQQACLTFIVNYIHTNACAPTYREIGEAMKISLSYAQRLVEVLTAKGYVK